MKAEVRVLQGTRRFQLQRLDLSCSASGPFRTERFRRYSKTRLFLRLAKDENRITVDKNIMGNRHGSYFH
jgi:hypothetical protein